MRLGYSEHQSWLHGHVFVQTHTCTCMIQYEIKNMVTLLTIRLYLTKQAFFQMADSQESVI